MIPITQKEDTKIAMFIDHINTRNKIVGITKILLKIINSNNNMVVVIKT